MRMAKIAALLMTILWAHSPVRSETVTLQEAVQIALKENPQLQAYTWTLVAQEKEARIAKGDLFPKFYIEEQFTRTDNPTFAFMAKLNQGRFTEEDFRLDSLNNPDPIMNFLTSFSFEMPLYVPRARIGVGLADKELEAKEHDFAGKKEEVALRVVQTYFMVQTAKAYVLVALQGMGDAEEHLRLSKLRYEAGLGLYSDVLRADVAMKEAEAQLVRAESNLDVIKRALGLTLGRATPIDVKEETPEFLVEDVSFYLNAASQRQDLAALKVRHEGSLKAVGLEKSIYLPEIGMGGSYFLDDHRWPFGSEGQSYIIMMSLKWNILDANTFERIRKAEAKAQEVEVSLSGFEKEIHFKINEAYSRVLEREKYLALARSSLDKAEEALRIVRLGYENAHAPMIDLLDTQMMLDRARAKVAEAENEHLTAIADLYFQSGLLLDALRRIQETQVPDQNVQLDDPAPILQWSR